MFDYKYLSSKHLKGLSKYKYSAIDTSPLSNYVMHPSWNALVKLIPKQIAPNVITLLGFLCMVAVVAMLSWFDYHFHAMDSEYAIPGWCFTACGVLVFLAYNLDSLDGKQAHRLGMSGPLGDLFDHGLDSYIVFLIPFSIVAIFGGGTEFQTNIIQRYRDCHKVNDYGLDGKQARRLGVSGPLGELFDHGLDSYIVFLIPFSIISIFGRDPQYSVSCFRGFLIVVSIVLNFYISHFEKYNTGALYLLWGYDVSMWVSSILFIIPGIYGPTVFKIYVFGLNFAEFFEIVVHAVGIITSAPVVIYNIYMSYKHRTDQMLSFFEAIRPLFSIMAATGTTVYWAVYSKNNVIEYDPRAFIFLYGTLFSNIASRLIVAEMTHQRCDGISWLYWPLLAGVITSLTLPQVELPILYIMTLVVFVAHVHYGVCVVRQICNHLKISCFTVPKDKRK